MLFLGLLFELLFLFVDIGYNLLMKNYPVINYPVISFLRQGFYIVFVSMGLFFVMFSGGYLTSVYAEHHSTAHSVVAAMSTCGIALYATSDGYDLTLMSALFVITSIVFAVYGNRVFIKNSTDVKCRVDIKNGADKTLNNTS